MSPVLASLVLTWMVSLQAPEEAPWGARFPELAAAISAAAEENPVFGTVEKTAAVLTAVAFFESHFDPAALGDCKKGAPKSLSTCQSIGAFQISKAHAPTALLSDPLPAARVALALMATSRKVCGARPLGEQLSWYAAGGPTCASSGASKSRHRMARGAQLLREMPPP